jgi:hypothetical protein
MEAQERKSFVTVPRPEGLRGLPAEAGTPTSASALAINACEPATSCRSPAFRRKQRRGFSPGAITTHAGGF